MTLDTTIHLSDLISFCFVPSLGWLVLKVIDIDKRLAVVCAVFLRDHEQKPKGNQHAY